MNAAKGVEGGARNYGRDGFMRFDSNGGRAKNYEPNSFDGPVETGVRYTAGYEVSGTLGQTSPVSHPEDDDFVQAGALYRVMKEDARRRLVENIASSLSQVSRPDIIERSIDHLRKADPEYGDGVAEAVAVRRR